MQTVLHLSFNATFPFVIPGISGNRQQDLPAPEITTTQMIQFCITGHLLDCTECHCGPLQCPGRSGGQGCTFRQSNARCTVTPAAHGLTDHSASTFQAAIAEMATNRMLQRGLIGLPTVGLPLERRLTGARGQLPQGIGKTGCAMRQSAQGSGLPGAPCLPRCRRILSKQPTNQRLVQRSPVWKRRSFEQTENRTDRAADWESAARTCSNTGVASRSKTCGQQGIRRTVPEEVLNQATRV